MSEGPLPLPRLHALEEFQEEEFPHCPTAGGGSDLGHHPLSPDPVSPSLLGPCVTDLLPLGWFGGTRQVGGSRTRAPAWRDVDLWCWIRGLGHGCPLPWPRAEAGLYIPEDLQTLVTFPLRHWRQAGLREGRGVCSGPAWPLGLLTLASKAPTDGSCRWPLRKWPARAGVGQSRAQDASAVCPGGGPLASASHVS